MSQKKKKKAQEYAHLKILDSILFDVNFSELF